MGAGDMMTVEGGKAFFLPCLDELGSFQTARGFLPASLSLSLSFSPSRTSLRHLYMPFVPEGTSDAHGAVKLDGGSSRAVE